MNCTFGHVYGIFLTFYSKFQYDCEYLFLSFTITGVMPGEYTVKASHPKWSFSKVSCLLCLVFIIYRTGLGIYYCNIGN